MLHLSDFKRRAKETVDSDVWKYIAYGESEEDNETAFLRYQLRPRVLRDVSRVDTGTEILGQKIPFPVCVGVSGMHKWVHSDGETATARAAAKTGTCYALGSFSTVDLEEVAEASKSGLMWMHVYIAKDRNLTESVIRRAEAAGFKAIVLTVDQPGPGKTVERLIRAVPSTSLPIVGLTNMSGNVNYEIDPSVTWKDVDWIRSVTQLPIVMKGILTAEDAVEATKHGIQGVIVSNHGKRLLEGSPATMDVLSEVVDAVQGKIEVYMDGGVRQGIDVMKALALGARAVFIGRPVLWGLACSGEEGVERVLEILRDEFRSAMMLSGCGCVADIKPSHVRHMKV